jgi:hypothetical protein
MACYEAKRGGHIDRFTIVFTYAHIFMGKNWKGLVYYVGASGNPEGFYQHGHAMRNEFCPCGSRVKWFALPEELRKAALEEYRALWEIDRTEEKNMYYSKERTGGE